MGKIMYKGENFPGGPNLLSELRDVNFSNVQDKQIILYDSTSRTWKNHTITAADVAYDENNSVAETISSLNSALGGVSMVVLGPNDFTISSDVISFKNATYAAKFVGAHIVTTGGYYATGIRSVNGVKTLRAAQANTTGASILTSLVNIVSVLVFLQN